MSVDLGPSGVVLGGRALPRHERVWLKADARRLLLFDPGAALG